MIKNKEVILRKTWVVLIVAGICNLLWGSAFPCIKLGYAMYSIKAADTASQILFAGIRFILAGIMSLIFGSLSLKKPLILTKDAIKPTVTLSLFQTILQYLFFYIGLANTSGVKASIIEASNVFIVIIVSSLIFKTEKLTAKKIIGSAVGFAGIILINLKGLDLSVSMKLTGEGFILFSTMAYSVSASLMKKYSSKWEPVMLSGWQFVIGGAVMGAAGLIMGGNLHPSGIKSILMLLYLAFISAAAYSLYSTLLKYNDVSHVAIYGFTNPMFGFILSAILLHEQNEAFGIRGLAALVLVCAGILIVNVKLKNKKSVTENTL